jgi:2-amino-4-hydroxy-6-hydroxymethyldihydropteridine diphosphokinase
VTPVERALVALGSNLGDREAHLAHGRDRLAGLPLTRLIRVSSIEETAPLGPVGQGPYLNQMVMIETGLAPRDLLTHCLCIEEETGRERRERWGPRTLDLDIVRFGERDVREPGLVVPHPELAHRPFWLREIEELEVDDD